MAVRSAFLQLHLALLVNGQIYPFYMANIASVADKCFQLTRVTTGAEDRNESSPWIRIDCCVRSQRWKDRENEKMCHHDSEKSIIDAGHSVAEMVDI